MSQCSHAEPMDEGDEVRFCCFMSQWKAVFVCGACALGGDAGLMLHEIKVCRFAIRLRRC